MFQVIRSAVIDRRYSSSSQLPPGVVQPRNEIGKEWRVTFVALWMILHGKRKWIIAQPHLFDDVIRGAPGFHFEIVAQPVDRLMVRAVDLFKPVRCSRVDAQGLDIVSTHFRTAMARNIEKKCSSERHIEQLHAFADRENRKAKRERLFGCANFPTITLRIYILVEDGRIRHWLLKKFRRNIRSPC